MNKAICAFLFVLLSLNVSAQQSASPILSKEAYLKKSKAQRLTGWLLLAGSIGLFSGAVATYEMNFNPFGSSSVGNTSDNMTSSLLGIAGTGALVGSIVSFSSARKNSRKAAAVTLNYQRILIRGQSSLLAKTQPALSLQIDL